MLQRRLVQWTLSLSALFAAASAQAQVLADRVPADALAYVGWAGSDALGPAYNASHLKSLLQTLNLPSFLSAHMSDALAKETNFERAENGKLALELLAALARSPGALYVGPIDFSNPARPAPRIALFSQIGREPAAKFSARFKPLFDAARTPDQPPLAAEAAGDFLLITIGDLKLEERLTGGLPTDSLAGNDAFKRAHAQLGTGATPSPAFLYLDAAAVVQMVSTAVQNGPDPQARQLFPPIAEGLGLTGLKQLAWSGNFDGANWQAATFLGMRERRNGLLAFFDHPPLTDDSLKLIPKNASSAGVFRLDAMRLLKDTTDAAKNVDEAAPRQIETVLTQIFAFTGVDLKHELLPSLGDEFIYYGSADATGNSLRGFTMFNRLRDPAKAALAFGALESFANLLILQRTPDSKIQFVIQPLKIANREVKAHVVTLGDLSPAWAIYDGTLFISLSVPALQSAMEMAGGKNESLLDNPQYVALKKKLGQDAFTSFSYADLKKSAPESYEIISHLLARAQAEGPNPLSVYSLPPLDKLMPDLGPAMTVYWSDRDGLHGRETGPFPFAGSASSVQFLFLGLLDKLRPTAVPPPGAPAGRGTP